MDIGIIGLGDMGKLYARRLSEAGYNVLGSDKPENIKKLRRELIDSGVSVLDRGVDVSRKSDFIVYSVEAENIAQVVREYGLATKPGAIVSGQTSVKTPEVKAFDNFLPEDVSIIPCHSLHGPKVNSDGQSLAVINHRSNERDYKKALGVFRKIGSEIVEMASFEEHDRITADTQALTHLSFQSMGAAWQRMGSFPWRDPSYAGGIDNVKVAMTLRIFHGKPHIYAGLALLNPFVRDQTKQYANSVSDLFKIMISEDESEFRDRVYGAKEFVFGKDRGFISLDDKTMEEFGLGISSEKRKPNSHLSLFGMVDAWHKLGINPYDNMICQTPPYKLRLGIAELLFKDDNLLEESIMAAVHDRKIRWDDFEFCNAVRHWEYIIGSGDMDSYKSQFENTKSFFKRKLKEGQRISSELIDKIA